MSSGALGVGVQFAVLRRAWRVGSRRRRFGRRRRLRTQIAERERGEAQDAGFRRTQRLACPTETRERVRSHLIRTPWLRPLAVATQDVVALKV